MTRRALTLIASAGALLFATLAPKPAAAEPSAGDRETSRNLYSDGTKALEATDYEAAAKACGAAFKLVAASTPGVCLGRALIGLGRFVEARDAFLTASRYPAKDGEPAVIAEARATARAEADKLVPRIPTLTLTISGAGDAQLRGSIDGEDMASETIKLPRRVNPGKHVIVIGGEGFADERVEIEIAEGEKKSVPIELHAASSSSLTLAYVALGVGGAGLLVGSIFGVLALGDKSTLDGVCATKTSCPGSAQPNLDTLHSHELLSTIGLGIGVIGVGIGAVLLLTRGNAAAEPANDKGVALAIGPTSIGLRGSF